MEAGFKPPRSKTPSGASAGHIVDSTSGGSMSGLPMSPTFQRGEIQVIELHGVSAEATHIYDPAVSLLESYRVLFASRALHLKSAR
jgi:hypothetical protein